MKNRLSIFLFLLVSLAGVAQNTNQPLIVVPAPRLPGINIDRVVICDFVNIDWRTGDLTQRTECHFVLPSGETFRQASQNPAYSEGDRAAYAQLAAPIVVVTETANSYVDQTGALLEPDSTGNYPAGGIPQTAFFHMIPVAAVQGTTSTPISELIRRLAIAEIQRSITRNKYGGYVAP